MQEILDYMYNLERFGMKLGLEVMQEIDTLSGKPHLKYKIIHIAGTNGKGSTAAFIAKILQEAGFKVGLYTSPHLVRFNERIKINDIDISDEELSFLASSLKNLLEENNIQATFFEFTTALAFQYFTDKKVDFAVIETGLGGRLDATNIVKPKISVITNISFDHMHILGETIPEIALEKAGIIKPGVPLLTTEKSYEALSVFRKVCSEKNSELKVVGINNNFELSLLGEHQFQNASLASEVCDVLGISKNHIRAGLKNAHWPGRLEMIRKNILIDCAHNYAGMDSLVNYLKNVENKNILIFGLSEHRNAAELTAMIAPLFKKVIVTKGNHHPQETSVIAGETRKYVPWVVEEADIAKALDLAKKEVGDGLIVITGSIYMVGDALKVLKSLSS
ncbi:MAG TPA: folylpolyglutamate synthase/dihydrofolate synthase family protein [Candidatus Nanoarchaeia archaeon]|nr:folylpolyglutamate synthase/dihydrofolate synthase family protein [Candidatus Nanoarchaeia archaeon]